MKNKHLKDALEMDSRPNYEVAVLAGVHRTTLSCFVIGAQKPSEKQKLRIASVLGHRVEELFPN